MARSSKEVKLLKQDLGGFEVPKSSIGICKHPFTCCLVLKMPKLTRYSILDYKVP